MITEEQGAEIIKLLEVIAGLLVFIGVYVGMYVSVALSPWIRRLIACWA